MPNIEELLRKAIEDGKFADLPGKGKPLSLDDNPYADPEWNMAYHMLKSSGYSLPWLETRQDILTMLGEQRQALRDAWKWRQEAQAGAGARPAHKQVEAKWQRAASAFREQMGKLDKRIRDFNLEAPSERFQLPRLQIEKEISALTRDGS